MDSDHTATSSGTGDGVDQVTASHPRTSIKQRVGVWTVFAALAGAALWSWSSEGILYQLTDPQVDAAGRIEVLKDYFNSFGVFSPLVYFVFVTIEVVVAPIPGLMLYAPGGIIFGPGLGGALALAGNVAGAGIACMMTRTLGATWLTRFFDSQAVEKVQTVIERRGGWLIVLLRLNPLTSSDIVSYAAGFTRVPVWKVMASTALGMAPLCFAQAWLADGLLTQFPKLIYPLLILCAVYVVAVVWVLRRIVMQTRQA